MVVIIIYVKVETVINHFFVSDSVGRTIRLINNYIILYDYCNNQTIITQSYEVLYTTNYIDNNNTFSYYNNIILFIPLVEID